MKTLKLHDDEAYALENLLENCELSPDPFVQNPVIPKILERLHDTGAY